MIQAPIPANEAERLQDVLRYNLLDTAPEHEYNDIARLASQICQTPMSTISLIDHYRQWHKAEVGLAATEADRAITFCGHTIMQDGVMEVPDAKTDNRFHDNPMVTGDPNVRFYAGIPLTSPRGYNIGSLCVIDTRPRNLDPNQKFALEVLARQVIKLFEMRLRNREIEEKNALISEQKLHLEELSAIQNKIISIVAHDIRGPVAALKNIIEARRDDTIDNEQVMEYMDVMNVQLDNTMYMLGNLVEWGALLRNKNSGNIEPVNLHELLLAEMKLQEIAFSFKHNTLNIQVPADCMLRTDRNMVCFMLRNLVSNANKFTENGSVTISAERTGDVYRIAVTDTGIGMSEELRTQLFNAGRQLSSRAGTHNEKGTGLGLLLTFEFAHVLGTALTVDSAPGKGTSIQFNLPAND